MDQEQAYNGKNESLFMKNYKLILAFFWIVFIVAAGSGCAAKREHNVITQVSTIDAILAGSYGGVVTIDELSTYGDTGIGTFDNLDGEMAFIDGRAYQVTGEGVVLTPSIQITSPFASMVWFEKDIEFYALNASFSQLSKVIEAIIDSPNIPVAIRMEGEFKLVHTRSVPAQKRPYPPLAKVVVNQPEFIAQNIKGKVVGFWLPDYVSRINVPGYHLHFVADDLSIGGHLLDLEIEKAVIQIDFCDELRVILPVSNPEFTKLNLKVDRTEDMIFSEQ